MPGWPSVTKENYAGVEYHCGTLQGKQVVVCCAGMGKANAASTVQVLCTKYNIDKLIFSGIAGNMTSKIGIGDVCVGETGRLPRRRAEHDCPKRTVPDRIPRGPRAGAGRAGRLRLPAA